MRNLRILPVTALVILLAGCSWFSKSQEKAESEVLKWGTFAGDSILWSGTGKKYWPEDGRHIYIEPTMVDGALYVPYDVSDAWRELDKMFPEAFVREFAAVTTDECVSDHEDDVTIITFDTVYFFLASHWQKPGSRLQRFMDHFFPLTDYPDNDILQGAPLDTVFCGYFLSKKNGAPVDFNWLIGFYQNALLKDGIIENLNRRPVSPTP